MLLFAYLALPKQPGHINFLALPVTAFVYPGLRLNDEKNENRKRPMTVKIIILLIVTNFCRRVMSNEY